uniref:Biogenesis of lysosome-related organelles complex 1 subunit 7 n=1 Tax=Meloidogyne javanica TaxID=6303 RepID=A0A915MC88_MELJA
MLKEHIKSSVVKTPKTTTQVVEEDKIEEIKEKEVMIEKEEEVKEYETIDQNIQKEEVTVDKVAVEEKETEEVETKEEENKLEIAVDAEQNDIRKIREFVVNLPISTPKSPSVVPLWDGCISIDDISSTDDAISQNQPVLTQLRDRHRQTSKLYSDMLEEQLLLLAQIQKMSSNPNNSEKVKTLMFRSKNIEKKTQQLKKQLEVLSASLENIKKSLN